MENIVDKEKQLHKDLKRLKKYDDLKKQGLLITLPCKLGTIVYKIVPACNARYDVCPYQGGYGSSRCDKEPCEAYIQEVPFDITMISLVNKTIFVKKEKALQKLSKGESNE